MILLYEALATLLSPLAIAACLLHPRLRAHARERLALTTPMLEPGAVWVHAASLGEGRAAEALVPIVRAPGRAVLRTCTSITARDQGTGADVTACLPVDVPFVVARWLDHLRPRCLLLVEAELWPALLAACARRGIPVVVVGARVGPGLHRVMRIPPLWRALTRLATFLPADENATAILGGTPIGELKRAAPIPPAALAWSRPAVIAGSTRAGEEALVLAAVRRLGPRPLLVLAPREPARWPEVARWLDAEGERWVARTKLGAAVPDDVDVVLLDSLGELAGLYANAGAAFVGGTFDAAIGGHSPAEAQAAGCPVVHGPHTSTHTGAFAATPTFAAASAEELRDAFARALVAPRPAPLSAAPPELAEALAPALAAPIPAERALRPWLWPLVPLWRLGVALRPRPLVRMPIPVIAVGGLTAGGSGKTPVTAWFVARLGDPAVVSRGYGRAPGRDVRTEGDAARLGDELVLLARRGVRVVSSPDRAAGVIAAANAGARVVVLDDALQNGDVARDLEVIVVDARWPLGGGPIPVGTGRVPPSWLARADVVWVNHGALPASLRAFVRPDAIVVEARYRPAAWLHRGERRPLSDGPPGPVFAFAGLARPEGFFQSLRDLGLQVRGTRVFADHHAYTDAERVDLEKQAGELALVTTEKDAARLPIDAPVWALVVEPEIGSGGPALEARVAALGVAP